jgi:hypothetical protein
MRAACVQVIVTHRGSLASENRSVEPWGALELVRR